TVPCPAPGPPRLVRVRDRRPAARAERGRRPHRRAPRGRGRPRRRRLGDPKGRRHLCQADVAVRQVETLRLRADQGRRAERRILLLPDRRAGGRDGVTISRRPTMKSWTWTIALGLTLAGCGTAPNQRIVTRTSTYMRAMTFGSAVGYPVDVAELERRYPELKGIVIPAADWVEEYAKLKKEADERGTPMYEYRIPFGANMTIEV